MYQLKIINSTIRPGRKGPVIVRWVEAMARKNESFEVDVLDLAEINLPLMNEPNHPSMQQYQHDHTKKWSARINEADAFIFVTGEYDFNYPAPLRNALEYLYNEWNYKAAGIVSYGGVSAGTRAANALKSDLSTFKVVPVYEMVNLPFFTRQISDEGIFVPNEENDKAARKMLQELLKWTKGLMHIRSDKQ